MFAGHGTRIPAAAGKVVGMFSGWLPSPFAPGEDETPQQAKAAREKVDPKDMEGKKSYTTLHYTTLHLLSIILIRFIAKYVH